MLKFVPLVASNLRRKPMRTGLTLASIVVAFMLFGLLKTLQSALELGVDLAGADRLVTMHRMTLVQLLPRSYLNRIDAVEGVGSAASFNWFGAIYQDERNQQLVMLLDTGRRLLARDDLDDADGMAHFDHVLDAALVVAYLALRQGDAVGLLAAGGDGTWVPPRRGAGAIEGLLRGSYALQPSAVATDFLAAATELSLRQRRRSLVMLVTNLRDEDMDDVLAAVQLLRKRHLVCVASLREVALDQSLAREVHDLPGAIRAGATAQYLQQRSAAHEALRNHGVMVLDVTCDQLAASLVERYLAVKRDGLL